MSLCWAQPWEEDATLDELYSQFNGVAARTCFQTEPLKRRYFSATIRMSLVEDLYQVLAIRRVEIERERNNLLMLHGKAEYPSPVINRLAQEFASSARLIRLEMDELERLMERRRKAFLRERARPHPHRMSYRACRSSIMSSFEDLAPGMLSIRDETAHLNRKIDVFTAEVAAHKNSLYNDASQPTDF